MKFKIIVRQRMKKNRKKIRLQQQSKLNQKTIKVKKFNKRPSLNKINKI